VNLLHQIAINLGDIVLITGNPFSGLASPFTADEALVAGDVVYLSGAGLVKKASSANRSQTIGVAIEDAALGEDVPVLFAGKATVIADGAINPGDPVAAAATAGRVVGLVSHAHSFKPSGTISSAGSHTHSFTPSGSLSTAGSHQHQMMGTTASGTVTETSKAAIYSGAGTTIGYVNGDFSLGYVPYSRPAGSHVHTFTGDAGTTGSAGSHSHTFTGSSGTTGSVGRAQIIGKAITSAAAAGDAIDILVSIAG